MYRPRSFGSQAVNISSPVRKGSEEKLLAARLSWFARTSASALPFSSNESFVWERM
jgi:hypothetical protein